MAKRTVTVVVDDNAEVTIAPLAGHLAKKPTVSVDGNTIAGITGTATVTSVQGSADGDADVDSDF